MAAERRPVLAASQAAPSPHPEERRLRRVSKDEARKFASGPHGSRRRAKSAAPHYEGLVISSLLPRPCAGQADDAAGERGAAVGDGVVKLAEHQAVGREV